MRKRVTGSVIGVIASVGLGAAMIPFRSHLSVATSALVLVIPVVAGVVTGGFVAGLVSVTAGFLVYDFSFIPPYDTLTVGTGQNWIALVVYVLVMVVISRVVSNLAEARGESVVRARSSRQLFELSELLLAERPLKELGDSIVNAVRDTFALSGIALLVPIEGRLEVVAAAGRPIDDDELPTVARKARVPVPLTTGMPMESIHTLALATSGRPVGLLVMQGRLTDQTLRELLPILANHLALALERAQLHERALRAEVLEAVDRWRRAMVGAVSHDLRTPLTTIKVASSTLLDPESSLSEKDQEELYDLIDLQTDRLTRLVTSLLDMTRVEAGVLEVHRAPWSTLDLIGEALATVRPSMKDRSIDVDVPDEIPSVNVDHLLIGQVLTNLLDNANRHAPLGTTIILAARLNGSDTVEISVADRGSGVASEEHETVFESFVQYDTGGRAGLGLALAKAFVEAHGGRIWVEDVRDGGARFAFTVPVVAATESGG